jgi:hypothetical protein
MADGGGESARARGAPATPRARARSAALWGLVGGFAFLALAQGYRLLGPGSLPVGLGGSVFIALGVGVASGGLSYLAEARLRAKRRT